MPRGPTMHAASESREGQRMKLHDDEVSIDTDLVRRLVTEQFPQLSDLPLSWAIFRWIDGQPYAPDRVDDERQAPQSWHSS